MTDGEALATAEDSFPTAPPCGTCSECQAVIPPREGNICQPCAARLLAEAEPEVLP